MYKEHPICHNSSLNDNYLWKYMDLWKFLDLINSSTLFFSKVNMMGDQHEGKVPKEIVEYIANEKIDGEILLPLDVVQDFSDQTFNYLKERILISCWTYGESESFAFWKMYAKDKLGVAMKTSLEDLKNSFNQTKQDVYIGQVNYFDPKKLNYNRRNALFPFLNKHRYYSYESEVRCIIPMGSSFEENFLKTPVDLNLLIQEIYISPFAIDIGFKDLLELIRDKYGLKFEIKLSEINDKWL